jgi:hypothetical protein
MRWKNGSFPFFFTVMAVCITCDNTVSWSSLSDQPVRKQHIYNTNATQHEHVQISCKALCVKKSSKKWTANCCFATVILTAVVGLNTG